MTILVHPSERWQKKEVPNYEPTRAAEGTSKLMNPDTTSHILFLEIFMKKRIYITIPREKEQCLNKQKVMTA